MHAAMYALSLNLPKQVIEVENSDNGSRQVGSAIIVMSCLPLTTEQGN